MNPTRSITFNKGRVDGFTFIELLAVLATVAMLLLVVLPALAGTKPNSQALQCLNNQRQLCLAWQMYTADNFGNLVANGDESEQPASLAAAQAGSLAQWCPGRQDVLSGFRSPVGTPAASNLGDEWIACGLIYPYVKNPSIYHCPADNYMTLEFGLSYPHARSVSMNSCLNPLSEEYLVVPQPLNFFKESSLVKPGPANTWVFIDENPASINDGYFLCEGLSPGTPPGPEDCADWIDGPACYHNGGCGLAYADGHAQIRKWTDPIVLTAVNSWISYTPATAPYTDLTFLESVTSIIAP